MDQITSILNTIIGDPLYIIIAIAFLVLIFFGVIKKLFKLTVIVILCTILYLAFIYFTKGPEEAAIEVDKIIKNPEESNFQPSEFKPDHNENSMEEE